MTTIADILKKLPDNPGVYLFYNDKKELIYVGKASSLKNRVRSYWNGRRTFRPIEQLIHEVVFISWEQTDSVLEAVILEGRYIKEHRPKYNVLWKDDKSWNYIVVTKDRYPEVETVREHDLKNVQKQFTYVFGPYPGMNVRATMKIFRRLFLISVCKPAAKRPCIYRQMGECLGVCTDEVSPKEYKEKVIQPLVTFLKGRKKQLIRNLQKKMKEAAKAQKFEEAARVRNQITNLQEIQDVALLNKSFVQDYTPKSGIHISRIEGYDISHLGATGVVGSMVVFNESGPIKSDYRKFKIRSLQGQSDVDALDEVITRRLNHPEWQHPDLFLIDGGRPQINRVIKVLRDRQIKTAVIGIAKGPERKRNDVIVLDEGVESSGFDRNELLRWISTHRVLLMQVRDEAHRFAISYQRTTRHIHNSGH